MEDLRAPTVSNRNNRRTKASHKVAINKTEEEVKEVTPMAEIREAVKSRDTKSAVAGTRAAEETKECMPILTIQIKLHITTKAPGNNAPLKRTRRTDGIILATSNSNRRSRALPSNVNTKATTHPSSRKATNSGATINKTDKILEMGKTSIRVNRPVLPLQVACLGRQPRTHLLRMGRAKAVKDGSRTTRAISLSPNPLHHTALAVLLLRKVQPNLVSK